MTQNLDLADIQGNILQDFVSGYPAARFFLLRITDAAKARQFVWEYRAKVTTALRWASSKAFAQKIQTTKPEIAINIGFTFMGLYRMGLPTRTLSRLPPEFIDGMRMRAPILGDSFNIKPDGEVVEAILQWDPVWRREEQAHIIVGLNSGIDAQGQPLPELARETQILQQLCAKYGLEILKGHGQNNAEWQDACALLAPDAAPTAPGDKPKMENNKATSFKPVPREHFGFIDGISNPVFEGQFGEPHADQMMSIGNGKLLAAEKGQSSLDRWAPLATGEFLLGYPDEAQEVADMAAPGEIMRNGTFMVFRKLHENVKSFRDYFDQAAGVYSKANNMPPGEACALLKAKMAGRWEDGVPVAVAPTVAAWKKFNQDHQHDATDWAYTNFTYGDDPEGIKCPVASHMRRTNTRDSLNGTSSVLNNRRRVLRRGQPYGRTTMDDDGDHGIIFLIMCADLARQFEFVQQTWLLNGNFHTLYDETDPLVGPKGRFTLQEHPLRRRLDVETFIQMAGGEYFFLPSLPALQYLASK